MVCACSETVTSHYPTREDAEADSLFVRGWLPAIIPASSRKITTHNDLDLNVSEGEFFFSPKDTPEFVSHLQEVPAPDAEDPVYLFSGGRATWKFRIDVKQGHCEFSMGYNRNGESGLVGSAESRDSARPIHAADELQRLDSGATTESLGGGR